MQGGLNVLRLRKMLECVNIPKEVDWPNESSCGGENSFDKKI